MSIKGYKIVDVLLNENRYIQLQEEYIKDEQRLAYPIDDCRVLQTSDMY